MKRASGPAFSPSRRTEGVSRTATGTPVSRSVSTTSRSSAATIARLYASLARHSGVAMKRVPSCAPA